MESMRHSTCGDIQTSVLSFGCGSVLGRVGRGASLRAMNAAWDAGITLFDTARSYGYGEAEAVLGEFLRGKRDRAIVATKFGIAPEKPSTLKRIVVPVVRAAMQVPGVRGLLKRGGNGERKFGEFTAEGLQTSLEESLRQLRTDYVDVLFLHEATAEAMHRHDLMAALDALVQAGKVRRVGLYGGADVVAEGLAGGPATLGAMQFGGDCFDPVATGFAANNSRGVLLIANHPFGSEERVARIATTLTEMSSDESVPVELREKLRGGDWPILLEAILGMVLQRSDALVFSMMREDHLWANVRAVESGRFTDVELEIMQARMLRGELVR